MCQHLCFASRVSRFVQRALIALLLATALFGPWAAHAQAAVYTWVAGATSTAWSLTSNWSSWPPPTSADTLTLINGTSFSPTNQDITGLNVAGITINPTTGAAFSITGSAVQVGATGIDIPSTAVSGTYAIGFDVTMTANQTWDVASGRTNNMTGKLSGAFNFTKNLSGTLKLGNDANDYTGKTSVVSGNGGTLTATSIANAGTASALGAPTTTANATIDLGGTLNLTLAGTSATDRIMNITGAATIINANAVSLTLNGDGTDSITSTGSGAPTLDINSTGTTIVPNHINQSGAGALSFTKSGSGTVTLAGANTFKGAVTINATNNDGALEFNSVGNVGVSVGSALGMPPDATAGKISITDASSRSPILKYIGTDLAGHSTDRAISSLAAFTLTAAGPARSVGTVRLRMAAPITKS